MQNNANNGVAPSQSNTTGMMQINDIAGVLDREYKKKIINFFDGKENKALMFLSGIIADIQRNPKLAECDQQTLFNSYMMMAQLQLMPSGVSGEAYVLPYNDRKRGMIAQFQLGYQGLVTLFYRAGAKKIVSEIVRKNDAFSVINGEVTHAPDVFSDDRGEAIGAYVIVELENGAKVSKVMSKKEIVDIGEKFSKSYFEYGTKNVGKYTPWNPSQDPELWMWKKTVLKQAAKLVPKNSLINTAIAEDNKDSIIEDQKNRFGDVTLPMPKKIAEKKANAHAHESNSVVHEPDAPKVAEVEESEPVYENVNDAMPCTKCGCGMTNSDVDFCDNTNIPHICAECRKKGEKTPASAVIAKRNSLKENGDEKAN